MRRGQQWIHGCLVLAMVSACGDDTSTLGASGGSTSTGTGEPQTPAPLCLDGGPLMGGMAQWLAPPFAPPGDMGQGGGDDDGGLDDGGIFLSTPDGGGVSFECDIFAQDCPSGEKCVPWANDGGTQWNANRCVPVDGNPAGVGQPCTVEGGPTSGIDDCSAASICWDVDRANEGTCIAQCMGDPSNPQCHDDQFCFQGYDGAVAVCMPWRLCIDDGVCQCLCPEESDPDCQPEQCAPLEDDRAPDELTSKPPVHADGDEPVCPDSYDPVVLYMSNDDSNSQASPILARRTILEGRVVDRSRIRIHEFLNYFDLSGPSQSEAAAEVGIEMRRTDAEDGEFTLVLRAQGRRLEAAERPPMNLVFSLDTSGSMGGEPMELLKDSMVAVAGELRAGDVVSVVTWNSLQTIELSGYPVTGPDDPELLGIIEGLQAGGSTDLHGGLLSAYTLAFQHHIDDGVNRVILVSDGGANTGITDIDLIASQAKDWDGEGTYLVGVGVGSSSYYSDQLMDDVTDAGKGAYVFIDDSQEAHKQFGERFLSNVMVSARNVRMQLTLPWYFGVKRFHGEEISGNPAEVEPQHLAPNDAMVFHQIVSACSPNLITTCDSITARVEYVDPITGTAGVDELTVPMETLVEQDAPRLYKADVVVGYAKALVVIDVLVDMGDQAQAVLVAQNMHAWAQTAADHTGDAEVQEIATLMGQYAQVLAAP
ncbi:vWA domain-containing protein [Paraliomyxa miuraensis]|uniref:vWA domain-containing protein n=1 Tax=Paraliomyxa miuraensis TaxID=376150 RepID=UPI002258D22C|nr:VWA domain-containing protein [Paraliomyxa miuraensis]MCX4244524.1 VWA domain-containing protein [Paraliomyxa miuraensis]